MARGYGSCSRTVSESRNRADLLGMRRYLNRDGVSACEMNYEDARGGTRFYCYFR